MDHGFKRLLVIGAGQMGHGIAQVAAQVGLSTVIQDISQEAVEGALARIEKSTAKLVEKGRLEEGARSELLSRLSVTSDLEEG
ncbi:MAG: 3-hydroxybutyryl-CoA dehydrogenase, partial [Myxococcales bacterium]|nr:3-hydroxybutyryl-CoA dehydrogenase [Myxococcales bacterium]